MLLEAFVNDAGGAARRAHLLKGGFTDRDVARALRRGTLVKPYRGCLAVPGASPDAIAARVLSGQLTCVSGARFLGLPVMEVLSGRHIAVHDHRGFRSDDARLRGVHMHRGAGPADDTLVAPTLTLIDHLGLCVGAPAQLAVIDACLGRRRITRDDLWSLTATDPVRRSWLVARADGRAQSGIETIARVELTAAGFAAVPQVWFDGVGHVDLLVNGVLAIETDGYAHHSSREAFAEDRRRDRVLELLGIRTLRYTYEDVMWAPGRIVADVRRILGTR